MVDEADIKRLVISLKEGEALRLPASLEVGVGGLPLPGGADLQGASHRITRPGGLGRFDRLLRLEAPCLTPARVHGLTLDGNRPLQPAPCDQQALLFCGSKAGMVSAHLSHLTLTRAGGDGVQVAGGHVEASDLVVRDCGRAGVSISSGSLRLSRIHAPADTLDHEPSPGTVAHLEAADSLFRQIQTSGQTPDTTLRLDHCVSSEGAALQVGGSLEARHCAFGGAGGVPGGEAGALVLRHPGRALFEDCAFYGSIRIRWEGWSSPQAPQAVTFRRCAFYGLSQTIPASKHYAPGLIGQGLATDGDRLLFEDCAFHGPLSGDGVHLGVMGGRVQWRRCWTTQGHLRVHVASPSLLNHAATSPSIWDLDPSP